MPRLRQPSRSIAGRGALVTGAPNCPGCAAAQLFTDGHRRHQCRHQPFRAIARATRLWAALALVGLAHAPVTHASEEPPAVAEQSPGARLLDEAQEAAAADDLSRARKLMEQAAATGEAEAINGLATFVSQGVGGEPDPKRARDLLEQAIAAGSIGARLNRGLELQSSDDAADQARAVSLLQPLYEKPPDDKGRAAVKAIAAGGLGVAYVFGQGVEQDVARGVSLLEECDAGGAAWDQIHFLLGRAYESGWGDREPDPDKSYQHFWVLANQGDANSQWRVAMALLAGSGAPLDEAEAYRWARKSAEAGYTDAELSTAVMLALGQGVAEDDAQAREWYTRAASKGSAHGLRGLGFMLVHGEGGERDAARGWAYLTLAAAAGEENAKQALARFAGAVTDAEKELANQISEGWVREHGAPKLVE